MRKTTYRYKNKTRSNKRNIKRSQKNILKKNKKNKTGKKRMRGGTTASLISTFTKISDALYNTCCAPAGQYRKNGVMLYKNNNTIVGQPSSPSNIKTRRDRSVTPPR